MNVHIDTRVVDLEEQHERWMALMMQHVVESLPNGVREQLVAYESAIDEGVLVVAVAAVESRRSDKAVQPRTFPLASSIGSSACAASSPSTVRTLEVGLAAASAIPRDRYAGD
jgi:hypothetical protein